MKGPRKRKSLKSMDKVIIVMEGTVEARGKSGGVQYTQKECCEIVEHYNDGGVAAMTRSGAQVETSFGQRAIQVLSTVKVKDEVRAIAIPSAETLLLSKCAIAC